MAHHAPRLAEIPGVFTFALPGATDTPAGVILRAMQSVDHLDRTRDQYARIRAQTLAAVALDASASTAIDAWELGLALMPELAVVPSSDDPAVLATRGALAMQYGVVPVWEALDASSVAAALAASVMLKRRARVLCRSAAAREAAEADARAIVLVTPSGLTEGVPPQRTTWGLWVDGTDRLTIPDALGASLDSVATRAVLGCNEVREPCG